MASESVALKHFVKIGDGFYHLRGKFRIFYVLNIGTHMAVARLHDGQFCVLDAIRLSSEQKAEIDALTDNGKLIESVIFTHPFHTVAIRDFYGLYPNAKYYGAPRHHRMFPDIPWSGDLSQQSVLDRWKDRGLQLRYPDGAEFDNPQPESSNHFSNVFAFHEKSKTVFNDDTICQWSGLGPLINPGLRFHMSIVSVGLYPTKEAPLQFKKWMNQLLDDWKFDNLCTAHNENVIGGAHQAVSDLLHRFDKVLDDLSARNAAKSTEAASG